MHIAWYVYVLRLVLKEKHTVSVLKHIISRF
jgi:hypothetical protein